ncbi:MAG TPA: PHP domain-containing protein [Desulfuromonadales bacterium]|nr:PHP domain-containing protein [Desulfuromonadales bacterium]
MAIDLHIHSSFSDGTLTPAELVALAHSHDVNVIAIADHDTVAGVADGSAAALAYGITVIPAVELSVQFESWTDVHLLGYGIDYRNVSFLEQLNAFQRHRAGRSGEILARVNDVLGAEGRLVISRNEVESSALGALGRPHIARALLKRGYVENMEDAFQRYLIPCAVPKQYWLIDDAIAALHRIGGVAVLAHPTSISKDLPVLQKMIVALQSKGLDGLEVYNNMAWSHEMEFLRRLAVDLGLIMTAGSDFHGNEQGLEIGRGRAGIRFEDSLLAPLYERLHR